MSSSTSLALRFCGCVRTQRTKRVDARPRFPLPLRFSPRRPQKRHRLLSSGSSPAGSSTDAGGAALIAPAGGWDRPKELSRVGTPYGGWYRAAGSSIYTAVGRDTCSWPRNQRYR